MYKPHLVPLQIYVHVSNWLWYWVISYYVHQISLQAGQRKDLIILQPPKLHLLKYQVMTVVNILTQVILRECYRYSLLSLALIHTPANRRANPMAWRTPDSYHAYFPQLHDRILRFIVTNNISSIGIAV